MAEIKLLKPSDLTPKERAQVLDALRTKREVEPAPFTEGRLESSVFNISNILCDKRYVCDLIDALLHNKKEQVAEFEKRAEEKRWRGELKKLENAIQEALSLYTEEGVRLIIERGLRSQDLTSRSKREWDMEALLHTETNVLPERDVFV